MPLLGDLGTVDIGGDPTLVGADLLGAARVRRLRGLGGRASSTRSSRSTRGSSSTRSPPTRSRPIPTRCGARCCAASPAGSRSSRPARRTRASTEPGCTWHHDRDRMDWITETTLRIAAATGLDAGDAARSTRRTPSRCSTWPVSPRTTAANAPTRRCSASCSGVRSRKAPTSTRSADAVRGDAPA